MRCLIGAAIVVLVAAASAWAQPAPAANLDGLLKESADAYEAGEYAKGFALLETVRDRAHADGLVAPEIEALLRLSKAYAFRNDLDTAVALIARARSLASGAQRPEDEARAILQLASVQYSQRRRGQPPTDQKAAPRPDESPIELARDAYTRFKAIGSTRGMAMAAEALVYYLPDGPELEAIQTEAMALPLVDGQPPACAVFHAAGDHLFNAGRLAEAYTLVTRAIACLHARRDLDAEANAHVSLGRVYRAHGRLEQALAEYVLAQTLLTRPRSTEVRAAVQATNAIAVTLQLMGRFEEARASFEDALTRARSAAPATLPFLLANLAGLDLWMGRDAEALAALDEAMQRDPATPYLPLRLGQRAMALAALGRPDEALVDASRAVELSTLRGVEAQVTTRRIRARLLGQLGRFDEAETDLRAAMDTVERVRANAVPSDVMRRGFHEWHQEIFETAIDMLGRQQKADAALETAERARARAFLDLRAEQTKAPTAPQPATVADAQRLATRLRSTIVAYWVGPTTLSIWVVRPGRAVRIVRLPVLATRLTTLIRLASGVGDDRTASRGLLVTERAQHAPWRELDSYLIAPIATWLPSTPGSRLTIVPHGPLFALSFAGLRDTSGRYLLERHDLHYVPAIAVLPAVAPARRAATGALLVGDPGRIPGEPGAEDLPDLPWARREVDAVRGSLGSTATVLAGNDAIESRVRAAIGGRRVLHFATHGVVSNEPNRPSYLALRPAPDSDGRFSADEIYGSTIDADLVVLSACRTALGPVEGDGVIGFTRAFLSAGARSVVATQWDVSDQVSYDVMRGFYARRAHGVSTSRALRGAQLAVLRALRAGTVVADGALLPETPRLWAGFILTGEP
jgi:CHAT domain-containing protein